MIGSLLLLTASLHAPTAYAAPGDPPSGSPAGAVYQLPLEQGRADGAPKGSGGTGAGSGGEGGGTTQSSTGATRGSGGGGAVEQGEAASLYRSENNFGSSSHVPGLAATGKAGGGGATGTGASADAGGAGVAGAAIAGSAVAAETSDAGNTSIPASVVLLGAIALLAVAVGVLSRRFARS
ncbi:MAG TPA: hypothetical protein VF081_00750 [Solirubrobacterales bacterium]